MLDELRKNARLLPELPGVYLLKDDSGRVIYVGKAFSLRRRVRSYLVESSSASPRLRSLQGRMAAIDYVVTDSEVEALILECSLIKQYRPRFNVNLKDDKDYPYLVITPEFYPRLELLRLSQKKSKRNRVFPHPGKEELRFGPYTDVGALRKTMRFLGTLFPLRRCRQPLDGHQATGRPCLNYQMRRCLGPCRGAGAVSPADYEMLVRQVVLFLRGRFCDLESKLRRQMIEAASAERFEEAAALRDRLESLQEVSRQQQNMQLPENSPDRDLLALARHEGQCAVHLFQVRDGRLLSQGHFPLVGAADVEDEEAMGSFVKAYYSRVEHPPPEILLNIPSPDGAVLEEWLKSKAGKRVRFRQPRRGSLKKLVDLAGRNCLLRLQEESERRIRNTEEPLGDLGNLLGLTEPPSRIEAYDISHLRGADPVGAMVVFERGEPCPGEYRLFNIREAPAGDDCAALKEVLERRGGRGQWTLPDFILIDGGLGQLRAAMETVKGTKLEDIPLAALAKNPDHLFLAGSPLSLNLPADYPMLKLLQRIRDEVHRFAVSGHRRRKRRGTTRSRLEDIPGVGPARRAALLETFGSMAAICGARLDELARVPGISRSLAVSIHESLHGDSHGTGA